jgi:hypothetical protein
MYILFLFANIKLFIINVDDGCHGTIFLFDSNVIEFFLSRSVTFVLFTFETEGVKAGGHVDQSHECRDDFHS